MYDAWYYVCTYLSVNGALEVSVEGAEGVVLGGKGQIHLLQSGLGGRGPGDGRYGEGVDDNLKLSVHCTKLAEDAAGQLGIVSCATCTGHLKWSMCGCPRG